MHLPAIVEKHPIASGAAVIGGAVVVFVLLRGSTGGGGTTVTTGGGISPAELQIAAQAQQAQYAAASQGSAQQYQLAALSENIAGAIALKNLDLTAAQSQIVAQTNANNGALALSKYQVDASLAALNINTAASLTAQRQQLNETQALATLGANTTTHLADLGAQVTMFNASTFADLEKTITMSQTQVALGQQQEQVSIANINASVQKHASNNSLLGGVLGTVASVALGFFGL